MAFFVGFISDLIVDAMLVVAENVLTRAKSLFKGSGDDCPGLGDARKTAA